MYRKHSRAIEPQFANPENTDFPSKLRSVFSVIRSAAIRSAVVTTIGITAWSSWARWKAEFRPERAFSVVLPERPNRTARTAQLRPPLQDTPDRRDGLFPG